MRAAAMIYLTTICALCAAGAWFGADRAVRWLETSTEAAITDALDAGGNDWAEVQTDGLKVVLAGTAPSESARARAFEAAARLVDTSRIEQRTDVDVAANANIPDFNLEILRSGTDLSLIGVLPGSDARVTVLRGFGELVDNDRVTDLMEAVDFDAPKGWDNALTFGIGAARDMPQSRIVVTPGEVSVEAFLPSPADVLATERSLNERLPSGVRLKLDLLSPKPVMSPFRFAASTRGEAMTVDICGAETEAGLILIENVLRQAGVSEPACTLALGAPSPRWSEAVAALVTALREIGDANAAITDTDIVLEGQPGTDRAAFEKTAGALERKLPPMFSFRAIAPPEPLGDVSPAPPPPAFTATLDEEGRFEMSGLVADEAARVALENYASAHFGRAAVTSDLKTDARVPGGWSPRIFAALDAMAQIRHGALSMAPGRLTMTGMTHDPDFGDTFASIAADRLEGFETDVKITVEPMPELSPSGPSARECERQLAAILDVGQIIFPPSSADVTDANELILDEIGFVIQTCLTARFEIGGHTDSQGRESMNLTLSQNRADALRDALIDRGIFPDLLVAKGYGESTPIADNDTEEGRAINRRIEFKLLGEGTPPPPEEPQAAGPLPADALEAAIGGPDGAEPAEPTSVGQMEARVPPTRGRNTVSEETQDDEQN